MLGSGLNSDYVCDVQYAYNGVTRYCATWWRDEHTGTKINVTDICYDMEWPDGTVDPATGLENVEKLGCAHRAPSGVDHSESPSSDSTPGAPAEGSPATAINTTAQFVREGLMNAYGMETWGRHQLWQDCKGYTAEGSAGRQVCQREAVGIALGRDVVTLRAMLDVIKVR